MKLGVRMSYSPTIYTNIEEASAHLHDEICLHVNSLHRDRYITNDVRRLIENGLEHSGCKHFGVNNRENRLVQIVITVTRCIMYGRPKSEDTIIMIDADPENPNLGQTPHYGFECVHNGTRHRNYHVRLDIELTFHRYVENKHVHTVVLDGYERNNIRYTLRHELTFVG